MVSVYPTERQLVPSAPTFVNIPLFHLFFTGMVKLHSLSSCISLTYQMFPQKVKWQNSLQINQSMKWWKGSPTGMFRIKKLPPDEACLAVFRVFPRVSRSRGEAWVFLWSDQSRADLHSCCNSSFEGRYLKLRSPFQYHHHPNYVWKSRVRNISYRDLGRLIRRPHLTAQPHSLISKKHTREWTFSNTAMWKNVYIDGF